MKIIIRTDASVHIGTGHVMRCLTLADRLKAHGEVSFLCQEREGNLIDYIGSRGFEARSLPLSHSRWEIDADSTISDLISEAEAESVETPVDWFIVDHYELDAKYETAIRNHVRKVMVIDDLANRPHACDLLLDQNPYGNGSKRYEGLVGQGCVMLLGPEYALLRPDFFAARTESARSGRIRNLLLSFGGADSTGETVKSLQAIERIQAQAVGKLRIKVLMGKINKHADRIRDLCRRIEYAECYDHAENVADLMREADLAIGSGGTTTWERCCLGLPAIVIMTADNQVELSENAAALGVISLIGRSEQVRMADIQARIVRFMEKPEELLDMSERGMNLVDGLGAERTLKELLTC
ncbi:UDP-2,4-diacetamido-2,4,6-trideoxy-beta-L-altropyranose hydrolase [Cohnella lupini]|uniref:UDP-2,4-diacetamido-2,4, 6-trideoxy-beta-L-altropyranose hydrolase n=1 Tax=Cohnella lupini TaxID=1294267 RepID=A0A3D9ITI7_9BACL|nr:UDP-2,4-diacetamido-2,4,6-trideoxy-beta-L-altropyranose hydrolase [Cohnella lupini]RED65062.1 UDP-2,4-diacetamido-2,4,6-trideoxy-beta-L-altropyranose hydrolase [Cohnella lupini]